MKNPTEQLNAGMSKLFGPELPQYRVYPNSVVHNFYIYGPVGDLPSYVDMITVLSTASEYDIINIYINTPGGCVNTMISIIHAMMRSQGIVITHADGEVASAGTFIFLAAPHRVVYPYSHFMLHDASSGAGGKVNENVKNVMATSELVEKLAYDIYMPTFSEEEVDRILEGQDYYCDAEEMFDRIESSQKELEQQVQAALDEANGETKESSEAWDTEYEVVNKRLKSNGEIGVIVQDDGGNTVTVELLSGKKIKIKRENLAKVEE